MSAANLLHEHGVGLAILRGVVASLAEETFPRDRAPLVAEPFVGVGVEGNVLFLGWLPGEREGHNGYTDDEDSEAALRISWRGLVTLAERALDGAEGSFVVDILSGSDVDTSAGPIAWDRERILALHRQLDDIGGIEEASSTWIRELMANLFVKRSPSVASSAIADGARRASAENGRERQQQRRMREPRRVSA